MIKRRVFIVGAGLCALALGGSKRSAANDAVNEETEKILHQIDDAEDKSLCERAGGKVVSGSKGPAICATPVLDEECRRKNLTDDKGKPVKAFYSYKKGECAYADCFLTSACVEWAGLADECFELTALRRFRDQVLVGMPGGSAKIASYYQCAPGIVRSIRDSGNPEREWARLYIRYILPSALAATLGLNALTLRIYSRMVLHLKRRYPA